MNIIKTKEELEARINFYKKIYNEELIEYYKSLINLEISALDRDLIPEDVINELKYTSIYNDISRFNIYDHALKTLGNSSDYKRLCSWRESLDFIIQSKIKDYNVFSYNPSKDEIYLYNLDIDENYRQLKIDDIKNNRIIILDKQISNVSNDINNAKTNIETFNLRIEKEQLEQAKDIALLEIKSLTERCNHEDYASSVSKQIESINDTFSNFYNIDKNEKNIQIGNTKVKKHTYHY